MSAFLVAVVRGVSDRASLERYWEAAPPSFVGREVKPLATYTSVRRLEGDAPVEAVLLMEFPSSEEALDWYESPEYQAARQHRLGAITSELYLVDGGVVADWKQRLPHIN